MRSLRENSRRVALCGILAALSVVFLSAGGILPLATFCCPILAMLCLLPVLEEYGSRSALLLYAAVSFLGLLLCPDKEVALLYAFLGWYPSARPAINRQFGSKPVNILVKLLLFAAAVSAMYALAICLLGMTYLAAEYAAEGRLLLALTVALAFVVWLLFDKVLLRFTLLYRRKWRGRLFRR